MNGTFELQRGEPQEVRGHSMAPRG
jgi:hypothetical protein